MRLVLFAVLVSLASGIAAPACGSDAEPTFNKDVAPILFNHCASCHRPHEVGPFSLLTFADARKRQRVRLRPRPCFCR